MPTTTIPLIANPDTRLGDTYSSSKDVRFINAVFTEATTSATQTKIVNVEKRNGLATHQTPSSGNYGYDIFYSPSTGYVISVFEPSGGAAIYIYRDDVLVGTLTTETDVLHISEAVLSGVTFIFFTTTGSGITNGWFLSSDAPSPFTATGDTHTNTTIDNLSSVVGIYVGQLISGTGIQAGTRVASISGSTITTTIATTATNSGVTITFEPLAKIIDSNFPTNIVGPFCELDGYVFVGTRTSRIIHSQQNSPSVWPAANTISANISTDLGVGAFKYKSRIGFFGNNSIEFFSNTGNAFGSVLTSNRESAIAGIGCVGGNLSTSAFFAKQDTVYWIGQDGALYTLNDGAVKISQPGTVLVSSGTGKVDAFFYRGLFVVSIIISDAGGVKWFYPDYNVFSQTSFTYASFSSDNYTSGRAITFSVWLDDTSGKTFKLAGVETNVFQDNGTNVTLTIQTQPYYLNDGHGFTITEVELIGDTQSSGSSTLATSADDYATFVTKGTFDLTAQTKTVRRVGFYKSSCAFRITDSGNNAWRGQALKVHWEPAVT